MNNEDQIIAENIAQMDRRHAQQLTLTQLDANISTYARSVDGTANARWREACVRERLIRFHKGER